MSFYCDSWNSSSLSSESLSKMCFNDTYYNMNSHVEFQYASKVIIKKSGMCLHFFYCTIPHCLGMSYYVNFFGALGSNKFHRKWRFGIYGSWKYQNPGCRIFILCEIHWYLCPPKSWHNNSFLGSGRFDILLTALMRI